MISLVLIKVILWYMGALFLLWHSTIAWCYRVPFMSIAPIVAIILIMLVNASFIYYDYEGTTVDALVQYALVLVSVWLFTSAVLFRGVHGR